MFYLTRHIKTNQSSSWKLVIMVKIGHFYWVKRYCLKCQRETFIFVFNYLLIKWQRVFFLENSIPWKKNSCSLDLLPRFCSLFWVLFNPLSANFTKWSNTLKQFVGNLPTNCSSVFDHFVGFALKGLNIHLL